MPLPELGLSLSITDSEGSPMYAGKGQREHMGETKMFNESYTITITISDEVVGSTTIDLFNDVGKKFSIDLPTYKMKLTDDKTNEESLYTVTRDRLLLKELREKESVGGFSLFGIQFFKKKQYVLPAVTFEPKFEKMETYEVSRYRTLKEDYLSYPLKKVDGETGYLVAGKVPQSLFETEEPNQFFCVLDSQDGKTFIGDILYREKFIKITPKVIVNVLKREKKIKEVELSEKGVTSLIYI
ncbi:hypothetical protein [Moheibacter stercoris]|uniref:Uncharacterized protein n=1 Tax=Moheibacter stercoris TaxID=1628251 RepID=A0ABV2LPI1_9FLAO